MRLTHYSEYSLRVLMYLALHPERLCSIAEIAQAYRISENHLTKVAHALGKQGLVETLRGRGGGLRLARPPEAISLGEVVRQAEGALQAPDCRQCPAVSACTLTNVFNRAFDAFLAVFDAYTVADIIRPGDRLRALLSPEPEPAAGA